MNPTTPIISGGMNALRMPGFFDNLGHSNLIMTAGGGAFGHIDGGAKGAVSLRQAEQCWRAGADPVDYAKDHIELARAFHSFPGDADKLYPGWREKLGLRRGVMNKWPTGTRVPVGRQLLQPSLRAQRSNATLRLARKLDCFVAFGSSQ